MLTMIVLSSVGLAEQSEDWGTQPFLRPQAGLSSWSSSSGQTSTALNLGAQAGLRFWQKQQKRPRIQGLTRAAGTYLLSGATGIDLRVGAFAGPAWDKIRLQTGPDLYWNQYNWGGETLPSTLGLAWPVQAMTTVKGVSLTAGVQPAFFLQSERASVDWSQESIPGIGDECTYFAAAGLSLSSLRLNVSLSQTVTAYGSQRGIGFGVRL
ncbi:MAG: hypothetical protein ACI8S6_006049 [Myxococcota bacterium]|jgi:hypothetical protein